MWERRQLPCGLSTLSTYDGELCKNTLDCDSCFRSFDVDFSMGIADTLAKQAPRKRVRATDLNDLQFPDSMKVVSKIKPVPLSTLTTLHS